MTTPEGRSGPQADPHVDVAAYVLGVLEDDDRDRFEVHLAQCPACQRESVELAGVGAVLDEFARYEAQVPAPGGAVPMGSASPPDPHPVPDAELLDRMLDRVSVDRHAKRRTRFYLVAAAVALIIGGPVATGVVLGTGGSGGVDHVSGPSEAVMLHGDTHSRTDPVTRAAAKIGMEKKAWGTHVAMELRNVRGPLQCSLVAVSKSGEQQTIANWLVPAPGYGIKGSEKPLLTHGAAAMRRNEIDHFEVRTKQGRQLVSVNV
jgi:hypothetical protein